MEMEKLFYKAISLSIDDVDKIEPKNYEEKKKTYKSE